MKTGLLIYGVNGSGKSSLSKAIGLSIIMAQADMYLVKNLVYQFIINYLRITSNDNLFKGKSSLMLRYKFVNY